MCTLATNYFADYMLHPLIIIHVIIYNKNRYLKTYTCSSYFYPSYFKPYGRALKRPLLCGNVNKSSSTYKHKCKEMRHHLSPSWQCLLNTVSQHFDI